MKKLIHFWIPIQYKQCASRQEKLMQAVDAYFYLGGEVAIVIPGHRSSEQFEGVMLSTQTLSPIRKWVKILSYATGILPAVALVFKVVLRRKNEFYICKRVLADGTEEIGVFSEDKLLQGIRIQNGKTILLEPHLLLKERYSAQSGIELNFAEVTLHEKKEIVPVQKEPKSSHYTLATLDPYKVVWAISQSNKKQSTESPLRIIFTHPSNRSLTLKGFVGFILAPAKEPQSRLEKLTEKLFLELLELAKELHVDFGSQINETLFGRWIGTGNTDLVKNLLAMNPALIKQSHNREGSFFMKSTMNGHLEEAELLFQAMQTHNVPLTPEDFWVRAALLNDCSFSEGDFTSLSDQLKQKIYQVANIYMHKPFIEKLRSAGMYQKPSKPTWLVPISSNMDAIDIELALETFLKDLRTRGFLLTDEEFTDPLRTKYFPKEDGIGRILGRDFIESAAKELGLDFVKVPKKIALLASPPSGTIALDVHISRNNLPHITSTSFKVYAEPIEKVSDTLTREQMIQLLDLVERTGASDLCCNNFFMGKNTEGEVGVYFVDTEYKTFSFRVTRGSTSYLKDLLAPEDHAWFLTEQDLRFAPKETKKPHKYKLSIPKAELEQLERYGYTKKRRTFHFETAPLLDLPNNQGE